MFLKFLVLPALTVFEGLQPDFLCYFRFCWMQDVCIKSDMGGRDLDGLQLTPKLRSIIMIIMELMTTKEKCRNMKNS